MAEYIEKQAAVSYAISGMVRTLPTNDGNENWIRTSEVRKNILSIPVEDVVPVAHGYWFVDERPESDREVTCSVCEEPVFRYNDHIDWRPKYCPHCGAKMDGGEKQ